jgi:predicted aspartyl protease
MNIQTFDYNRDFSPAAPFVEVEVNNYDAEGTPVIINAQIDSGADATMMPIAVLEEVGALFEATHQARDFSGRLHLVDLYATSVNLAGQTFYLSVIAQENTSKGVIGRGILNDLVVTLNGPANVTEIAV